MSELIFSLAYLLMPRRLCGKGRGNERDGFDASHFDRLFSSFPLRL